MAPAPSSSATWQTSAPAPLAMSGLSAPAKRKDTRMNVYVVIARDWETAEVVGIYASESDAQAHADKSNVKPRDWSYHVEEWPVTA